MSVLYNVRFKCEILDIFSRKSKKLKVLCSPQEKVIPSINVIIKNETKKHTLISDEVALINFQIVYMNSTFLHAYNYMYFSTPPFPLHALRCVKDYK